MAYYTSTYDTYPYHQQPYNPQPDLSSFSNSVHQVSSIVAQQQQQQQQHNQVLPQQQLLNQQYSPHTIPGSQRPLAGLPENPPARPQPPQARRTMPTVGASSNPTTSTDPRDSRELKDGEIRNTFGQIEPSPFKDSEDTDETFEIRYNCNQIRKKIESYINSKALKVKDFQEHLRITPRAYASFMKQSGPHQGMQSSVYTAAHLFFVKREDAGLKMPKAKTADENAKKLAGDRGISLAQAKKEEEDKWDGDKMPVLGGEKERKVPVFDTCDDIRSKINAFLKDTGMSAARLCREMSKLIPGEAVVSANTLANFRSKSGSASGATASPFYAGYVYFEKIRVRDGKGKTKKREEMEGVWGEKGMDLENDSSRPITMHISQAAYFDKHGKLQIVEK
ncbi:hypothetical protein LTR66_016492 [Elasticomyces elasticus]|nr:hypothetical protein LTR66_016492 [Elasticomyces elasticus]